MNAQITYGIYLTSDRLFVADILISDGYDYSDAVRETHALNRAVTTAQRESGLSYCFMDRASADCRRDHGFAFGV